MGTSPADDAAVEGLRAGDELVFTRLLDEWSRSMLALARSHVSTDASAEEVVQDTWLAVLRGIDRFEGRSSLRTWVYRILVNTARKRGARESRSVPWSSVGDDPEAPGPTLDPSLFRGAADRYPGGWLSFPVTWRTSEDTVLAGEAAGRLRACVDALPDRQRTVITMRDVLGHSPEEVCGVLGISAGNQRVLLHRARAAVRAELAPYLAQDSAPDPGEETSWRR